MDSTEAKEGMDDGQAFGPDALVCDPAKMAGLQPLWLGSCIWSKNYVSKQFNRSLLRLVYRSTLGVAGGLTCPIRRQEPRLIERHLPCAVREYLQL